MLPSILHGNILFILTPIYTFVVAALMYTVVPLDELYSETVIVNYSFNFLLFIILATMSEVGVILSGINSISKLSRLGSLIAISLMISSVTILGFYL